VYDWEKHTTLNTYNVERQLIQSRFYLDSAWNNGPPAPQMPPGYQSYMSEESYRYDALGRRIYARVVRGANCADKDQISGCRSSLTRTVWDGDQIVAEIRIPGDSSLGAGLEQDAPEGTTHQGVVRYLHAGGLDAPVALWKAGATAPIELHADWRGAFVMGTCPSAPCDGDVIWFPATVSSVYGAPPSYPFGPPSWHGSLVEGGQDASGLQYRRNRYYDPRTGRFTQEDPIGLAGGLNLYGFANGDPINFSDPFGLWPDWLEAPGRASFSDIFAATKRVADRHAVGFDDLDPRFMVLAVVSGGGSIVARPGFAQTQTLNAISAQFRNMTTELATHNHFRAARLELRGTDTGGQHLKELSDMARGLRGSARQLQDMLKAPGLSADLRTLAEKLLSNVSRLADRMEAAIRTTQ
jgi:RHS repeat-associated protein